MLDKWRQGHMELLAILKYRGTFLVLRDDK